MRSQERVQVRNAIFINQRPNGCDCNEEKGVPLFMQSCLSDTIASCGVWFGGSSAPVSVACTLRSQQTHTLYLTPMAHLLHDHPRPTPRAGPAPRRQLDYLVNTGEEPCEHEYVADDRFESERRTSTCTKCGDVQ